MRGERPQSPLRSFGTNILKGIGLGLGMATGFTAWITFLRLTVGTSAFTANGTTYPATVALYYGGFAAGGFLVGLCWPLRRWVLGYALLGMLGVFPVYLGVGLTQSSRSAVFSDENLFFSIFASVTVGGIAGILSWMKDHTQGPRWLDTLRHPTVRIIGWLWTVAATLALIGYFGVSTWTAHASFLVEVAAAVVFFVGPLGLAALVTAARYSEGKDVNPY